MDIYPTYGSITGGAAGDDDMEGDYGLPADLDGDEPVMTGSPKSYDEQDISYAGDTGELLDTEAKELAHFKRQIERLSEFLLKNYDDKICGSAIETAMTIINEQEALIEKITMDLDTNSLLD